MNINTFGGRKFLLCVGCGIATTALTWAAKIDGSIYAIVIVATIGAYITGNATQKVLTKSDSDSILKG